MKPFDDPSVAAAFDAFPVSTRTGALLLRELILDTAQSIPSALPLQEALRWGQPAYLGAQGIDNSAWQAQIGAICPFRAIVKAD